MNKTASERFLEIALPALDLFLPGDLRLSFHDRHPLFLINGQPMTHVPSAFADHPVSFVIDPNTSKALAKHPQRPNIVVRDSERLDIQLNAKNTVGKKGSYIIPFEALSRL